MLINKNLVFSAVISLALPMMAQAQEVLTLYTSQPNKDAQKTVDAFEAQYPNIDVQWVRDGTTKLMTKLRAELDSGVVKPDVLLIADTVTMESLITDKHLLAYPSLNRSHFDASLYHGDGYYHGTKLITSGIVRHTSALHSPSAWSDLTAADYKSQLVMPSPLYSGAALIHLATLTDNPDLGWNYYQSLKDNGAMAQGGNAVS